MKPVERRLPDELRAVLLDWDGTLLDSFHADSRAYLAMFRALEIPWGLAELERHYSPDWYKVFRAARIPRERWDEADRLWRRFYRREKPALVTGARRVLRWLARRYTLGLVTSGDRVRVTRQLRQFELLSLFAARVFHEDSPRRKPHPAPLRLALQQLDAAPGDCLYVGDAAEDVVMARRAGVCVVGVLGSFPTHHRIRAARPDALLDSLAELPALLDGMQERR
jgi:HAD superfamily hydrolase (TIGR01549 family)